MFSALAHSQRVNFCAIAFLFICSVSSVAVWGVCAVWDLALKQCGESCAQVISTWTTDWLVEQSVLRAAHTHTHTPVATKMWSEGFCFPVNRHGSISIHGLTAEHTVWVLEASQMHRFPHKSCICIFKQRCGFCLDVFTFSSWYGASNLVSCLLLFSCICMACLLYTFAILPWEVGKNMFKLELWEDQADVKLHMHRYQCEQKLIFHITVC